MCQHCRDEARDEKKRIVFAQDGERCGCARGGRLDKASVETQKQ
jgi:hypothetical protein